jgi:prepilin-type N-terminal cleavage/methylation domain-containing protein
MSRKMIHKGQKGFTLVELVIVVALAGIVSVAIVATTFQVFTFSALASNQMTAIRQVQQAGFWVSPDVMMADPGEIDNNPAGGEFLVLRWQAHDGTWHEVDYVWEGMPSSDIATLLRYKYSAPDLDSLGPPATPDSITTVAQYIDHYQTSFVPAPSGGYDFEVVATVGEQTETRTYEVQPRVGT